MSSVKLLFNLLGRDDDCLEIFPDSTVGTPESYKIA